MDLFVVVAQNVQCELAVAVGLAQKRLELAQDETDRIAII
jgi:hypothetical protein